MNSPLRLSRLSHPRATLGAIALLVIAFVIFGTIAEAHIQAKNSQGIDQRTFAVEETLMLADNQGDHR